MVNRTYRIATALLEVLKKKYNGDCSHIPEIKVCWHNTVYLLFSEINRRRLFASPNYSFDEMVSFGLMPKYLYDFYQENLPILKESLDLAIEACSNEYDSLNECRQELLNIEIDFSGGMPELFSGKVSRDNTGAYYTPRDLALAVVENAFSDFTFEREKEYKIADFSCGGGDFFLAIIDYVGKRHGFAPNETVRWFYGVDIDPIALQICIVNLLEYAHKDDWKEIISHFSFGNPLIINNVDAYEEEKNRLFAIQRLYASELGLPNTFFDSVYDAVVGNPPWEKIRFEERKFFRGINNTISAIPQKNLRDAEVVRLKDTQPDVYAWRNSIFHEYADMTASKYAHCKIKDAVTGELNTYALFTELGMNMLSDSGILALVVKSTLVTAPVHQKLWNRFLSEKTVKAVYLFENKNKVFNIDSRERFVVFIASKRPSDSFKFSAGLTKPDMMETCEPILLSAEDLLMINPFTRTVPNVSNNEEISFLKNAHKQFGLFSEVHPTCHFGRLIHLTAHAAFIDKEKTEDNIPVYEGKFIEQYDARYATFKGLPKSKRYAAKASAVKTEARKDGTKDLPECRFFVHKELWNKYQDQYSQPYSLCWRSLTSPTNRRTMLAMIIPTCPTCQSIQMLQTPDKEELVLMLALFNSIPFDYFVRIKMPGLDLTQSVIRQIPVPSDSDYQQVILFDGKKETIKTHILSYAVSILEDEDRLKDLTDSFDGSIYRIEDLRREEKKKMIDLLFKEVYHLDNKTYDEILLTFPKYQASHTV